MVIIVPQLERPARAPPAAKVRAKLVRYDQSLRIVVVKMCVAMIMRAKPCR